MKTPPFQGNNDTNGQCVWVLVFLIDLKVDLHVGIAIWRPNPGILFSLKMKDIKRKHHHFLELLFWYFTGGKKCPACKQVIYHERWKVTPKLAEERWAHHEAKKRELSEVVDFLGDCL